MAIKKKKENEVSAVLTPIRSNTGYSGQSTTGQNTSPPSSQQTGTPTVQNLPFPSPLTQKKNEALDAYLNRDSFKYDFNADALYQHYKDAYVRQGQQAMQDTMGQAAALTGGYGSSYAQNVGQQAYNQHLTQLNDVVPELYRMAYEKYQNEGNELLQRYGLLADEEAQDYSRWYQTERDKVADSQWKAQFDEGVRQYNQNYDYQVGRDAVADSQWQQSFDYQKERDTVGDQQWQQSFDYQKGRDAVSDSQWQQSFDYQKYLDAEAAKAQSSKVTKEAAEAMAMQGDYSGWAAYLGGVSYETAKQHYISTYGDPTAEEPIEKPIYSRRDPETGNYIYYYGGKEVEFEQYVNPLTGKANPDAVGKNEDGSYKAFLDSNGNPTHQPNNIGGVKLKKAGWTDTINGHEQNVWEKTDDMSLWMWDDLKGVYTEYDGLVAVDTARIDQFEQTLYDDYGYRTASQSSKKGILENRIEEWLKHGKINDNEAATLIARYGL